jgi:hypothetical protein
MSVRERIDRVFSREVLGATFVGLSAGKIVETAIGLLPAVPAVRFVGWGVTFVAAVALFVTWESVEQVVEDATGSGS